MPPLANSSDGPPAIPVLDTGRDFPVATLAHFKDRAHALFDSATAHYPSRALTALDKISRAWLARWDNAHLPEIDAIAVAMGRPGTYFFSVNYEWGCTCRVAPSPDGRSARLVRVLDWLTPGLGANVVAVRVSGAPAGAFSILTWPGYSGVLQVMAPGRFSAALNQAPMRNSSGLYYVDWAVGRGRVWGMPHSTPAHLLRDVSETATTFAQAKDMLCKTPVSTPGIYTLAGLEADELAVVERQENDFRLREGPGVAANHWETAGWQGHPRGVDSAGRARQMCAVTPSFDKSLAWLQPPVLNARTRLALVADAREGRMIAQGFEAMKAATCVLDLAADGALLPLP